MWSILVLMIYLYLFFLLKNLFTVKDRQPVKSLVIGRPILLALEDIDGTPSFLEKALRFIERHGVPLFHLTPSFS